MLSLHIQAPTAEELQKQIATLAALQSASVSTLSSTPTDVLLTELRQRLASQGFTVRVVKTGAEEETSVAVQNTAQTETVPATEKKKPGRKPNAEKAATVQPEPPKTVNPDSDTAKAMVEQTVANVAEAAAEDAAPLSIEDVKSALNKYAEAHGGVVAARAVMKKSAGSEKLMDIPTAKYGELIEALQVSH